MPFLLPPIQHSGSSYTGLLANLSSRQGSLQCHRRNSMLPGGGFTKS